MAVNTDAYKTISAELAAKNVTLVAVSKTKPAEDIVALYELGQRDFGENYVQELVDKQLVLPKDIRWHFIGHLQSNKVKYIAPFVHLIHGVDSLKLLKEINKQGARFGKMIDCLLQVHIAEEETKFGLDANELEQVLNEYENAALKNVSVNGLMGMASFTNDEKKLREEFSSLTLLFGKVKSQKSKVKILSIGMSSDYKIAVEEGSTMVRVGSLLFGNR